MPRKAQKRQKWRSDTPRKMMESGKIVNGGMAERLNAPVLKTVGVERLPGVRIPLPPPVQVTDNRYVTQMNFQL